MSIKSARKLKGYSQEEISKIFDIPLRTLKRYESSEKIEKNFKYKLLENQIKKLEKNHKSIYSNKEDICIVSDCNNTYILGDLLGQRGTVYYIDHECISEKSRKKCDKNSTKKFVNFSFSKWIIFDLNFEEKNELFFEALSFIKNNDLRPLVIIVRALPEGVISELVNKYTKIEIIYCPIYRKNGEMCHSIASLKTFFLGVNRISLKSRKFARIFEESSNEEIKAKFVTYKEAEIINSYNNKVSELIKETIESISTIHDDKVNLENIINLIK